MLKLAAAIASQIGRDMGLYRRVGVLLYAVLSSPGTVPRWTVRIQRDIRRS